MVPVLLAPLGVDAPCLDGGAVAQGDMNRVPSWRNAQRIDALQCTWVPHGVSAWVAILERRALRAVSSNPSRHGHVPAESKKGSGTLDSGTTPPSLPDTTNALPEHNV